MNTHVLGFKALKWTRRALRLCFNLAGAAALAIGTLTPSMEALTVLLLIIFGVQLGTCFVVAMDGAAPGRNCVRPLITAACWWVIPVAVVAIANASIPNPTAADFMYVALVSVTPFPLASAAIALGSKVVRAHGERGHQVHVARVGEA